MNRVHWSSTEGNTDITLYKYHLLPLLVPNDSKLTNEIAKVHEYEGRQGGNGTLSHNEILAIVVPLVHALFYFGKISLKVLCS